MEVLFRAFSVALSKGYNGSTSFAVRFLALVFIFVSLLRIAVDVLEWMSIMTYLVYEGG